MAAPRDLPTLLSLVLGLALASCQAQRSLVVTSAPTGAEVRLDGRHVGVTPLELPFQHYGTRRVTLYLDGYITHSEVIHLRPPWYGRFPIDLFSEVLIPVGWHDEHAVHAALAAGHSVIPTPELESVIQRSEELRRAGPDGPVPPAPPPRPTPANGGS